MKAPLARSRARTLIRVRASVTLWRVAHDRGDREELRADSEPGPLRGVPVDLEAKLVRFDREVDDAAKERESVHVSDGQHRQLPQGAENRRDVPAEGRADEEDVDRAP